MLTVPLFATTKLIVFTIFTMFTGGLKIRSISHTIYPGQRIQLSVKNFIFTTLTFGLAFALLFGWSFFKGSGGRIIFGIIFGLAIGLIIGIPIGLNYGGKTIFQHYALRLIIARYDFLPWRLVPFLDYCVDRIFLRRVGGGYIFVHRLLMEHFAAMYPEENFIE